MSSVTPTEQRPTVLAVDDTPANLALLGKLLRDHYRVKVASRGEEALRIAEEAQPDIILLDVMMPGMSGHEVCRRLKMAHSTNDIPVIFITALSDTEDEAMGLALGAVDYITKPISPPILMARVSTHLQLKAASDFLRNKNAILEEEVARRTAEVRQVQEATIFALASLAETRDSDTGNHLLRTQQFVRVLAKQMALKEKFAETLSPRNIKMIYKSAPLHDIGKVGVPDRILLKPGRLTPEEFKIMKTHTTLGKLSIEHAEQWCGVDLEFLAIAKQIAYSHQEKWDGSGYPQGLAGEDIPLPARLMALADVYDALVSRRVYKPPIPHEQAVALIVSESGRHFDPEIVEAFLQIREQFQAIATQYADTDAELSAKSEHLSSFVE